MSARLFKTHAAMTKRQMGLYHGRFYLEVVLYNNCYSLVGIGGRRELHLAAAAATPTHLAAVAVASHDTLCRVLGGSASVWEGEG